MPFAKMGAERPSPPATNDDRATGNKTSHGVLHPALAPKPHDELVILDKDPGRFLFGAFQNVSILIWVAPADGATVTRLSRATANLAIQYPQGRSCVSVTCPGVPLPSDAKARAGFVEILKRSARELACLAVVTETQGFERSAVLSYHTSMRLASQGLSDLGFFESIEKMEAWLPERHLKTGVAVDPARLGAAARRAIALANHR